MFFYAWTALKLNSFERKITKIQLICCSLFLLEVQALHRPTQLLNRRTQLLFANGIERGIHDHQLMKYQPLVKPRLIFQYSIIINGIKLSNITLGVTDG